MTPEEEAKTAKTARAMHVAENLVAHLRAQYPIGPNNTVASQIAQSMAALAFAAALFAHNTGDSRWAADHFHRLVCSLLDEPIYRDVPLP